MTSSTKQKVHKSKSRQALAPLVSVVVLITAVVIIGTGAVAWSNYSITARENLVGPQVLKATDKMQESITLEHFWYNTPKQQLNLVLKNTGNIGVNFTQIQIIGSNSSGTALQIIHTGVAPNGVYTAVVPYFWLGDPLDAFASTTRGSIFRMHLAAPSDGILIFKKISMLNNGNFNFTGDLGNFGINTTGFSQSNTLDSHGNLILTGTIRDFNFSGQQGGHPDFENCADFRLVTGIVLPNLGSDYEPVYNNSTNYSCSHGFSSFKQWYHDDPTVNTKATLSLNLTKQAGTPVTWYYGSGHFFPLDNKLFCKGGMGAGKPSCSGQDSGGTYHNFSFTMEVHNTFTYRGGETLTFTGDDSVWVFINKQLVIDLGGVHSNQTGIVALDSIASQIGIVKGSSYPFDLFYSELHTVGSDFAMTTSIQLQSNGQGSTAAFFVDPGTYNVNEFLPPGTKWIVENMQCTGPYTLINSTDIKITVPKGVTTCTYTDSQ